MITDTRLQEQAAQMERMRELNATLLSALQHTQSILRWMLVDYKGIVAERDAGIRTLEMIDGAIEAEAAIAQADKEISR